MTSSLRLPGVRGHLAAAMRTVLSDSGEPLRADVRSDLEPRFAADFSTVRAHAGESANASARHLKAKAFAVGQHIVFGEQQFARHTAAGRALLAQELTHSIQQRHTGRIPRETTTRNVPAEVTAVSW
jgi:hypothetical protein